MINRFIFLRPNSAFPPFQPASPPQLQSQVMISISSPVLPEVSNANSWTEGVLLGQGQIDNEPRRPRNSAFKCYKPCAQTLKREREGKVNPQESRTRSHMMHTRAAQHAQILRVICVLTDIATSQPTAPPILHTDNNSATSAEECNRRTSTLCAFPFRQEQSRAPILVHHG